MFKLNISESESECKCLGLTCNQKPTGSQFSLGYCTNQTKRLMEKLKRKPLSSLTENKVGYSIVSYSSQV